jgi:two-component system invasion response regulator UvrY
MLTVLIAEPLDIFRAGLRQLVVESRVARQIGAVASRNELEAALAKQPWQGLVYAIPANTSDAFSYLRALHERLPDLRILVFGSQTEAHLTVRALKAGASGYLPRTAARAQVLAALQALARGRKYLPAEAMELIANNLSTDWDGARHDTLSEREYETLCLIGSGLSLTDIATRMQISAKTVSAYRARIISKMQFRNNAEMTYYVVSNNLLS